MCVCVLYGCVLSVCVSIRVAICVHDYIFNHDCLNSGVPVGLYELVCLHVFLSVHVYMCVAVCVHWCIYICVCMHNCMCVYVCVCVYLYV